MVKRTLHGAIICQLNPEPSCQPPLPFLQSFSSKSSPWLLSSTFRNLENYTKLLEFYSSRPTSDNGKHTRRADRHLSSETHILHSIQPIVYNAIEFDDRRHKIPIRHDGTLQTRHLALVTQSFDRLLQYLEAFPNLESLAIDTLQPSADFCAPFSLPAYQRFRYMFYETDRFQSLKQLSISVQLFQLLGHTTPVAVPFLPRLTHLELTDWSDRESYEYINNLKLCTSLTHLAIDVSTDYLENVERILHPEEKLAPNLHVFCARVDNMDECESGSVCCSVRYPGLLARFREWDDKRVVLMDVSHYEEGDELTEPLFDTSWYEEEPSFWEQVDAIWSQQLTLREKVVFLKRQRGEIMDEPFLLSSP